MRQNFSNIFICCALLVSVWFNSHIDELVTCFNSRINDFLVATKSMDCVKGKSTVDPSSVTGWLERFRTRLSKNTLNQKMESFFYHDKHNWRMVYRQKNPRNRHTHTHTHTHIYIYIYIYIYICQPVSTGRMRHKVNFLTEFNSFKFRFFRLVSIQS